MKDFYNLMRVKDTTVQGNFSAVAQYTNGVRSSLDFYFYRTCICTLDLFSQSFEMTNDGWHTIATSRAMKQLKEYFVEQGYMCKSIELFMDDDTYQNLDIRIAAHANKGGNIMINQNTLYCEHVGCSNRQLKSIPPDIIYLASDKQFDIGSQITGAYMRGRNEKQISENVAISDGIKFTLHFQLPMPPNLYALWHYKTDTYLFRFRVQNLNYYKDFQSLNATYTATEMYKLVDETTACVLMMSGYENMAYAVYSQQLDKFQRLA